MQIGDINVVESLINSELRLGTLEKIFDYILNHNVHSINKPTQLDIDEFKNKTISEIQSKYPNSGIKAN